VIDFKFRFSLRAPSSAKLDLSKRALLSAGVGGLTGLVAFRLSPQSQGRGFNPALIRPPGARDERAFLQRCLQCGVCMKACPTNGLQPTLFEAGLEGIWTPMLVPRIGYCEYNCNLCGQVCPTQAIQPLTLEEKRSVKLGLATLDTTRCLPYAYNRECMICEEHCPTPKKAIYFMAQELKTRDGKTITLKQPYVDPDLCTGCGICENVCVFKDQAAIRVTSANETRHSGNRPVLPGLPEKLGRFPISGGSIDATVEAGNREASHFSAPVESPTESASAPYAQTQNNPYGSQ
jgi:MauM/NapG family ferredoxin protein